MLKSLSENGITVSTGHKQQMCPLAQEFWKYWIKILTQENWTCKGGQKCTLQCEDENCEDGNVDDDDVVDDDDDDGVWEQRRGDLQEGAGGGACWLQ